MAFRGAIFDWDGVIINSAEHHERSWIMTAAEAKLPWDEGIFIRTFGMKNETIIPEILNWSRDSVEIRRLSLRKEELYRQVVREIGLSALPGVEEWLAALRAAGIPCVIASSTQRENIMAAIEMLGLTGFFAGMVTAEDVTRGKPEPEVFLTAAARIGVEPAQAVVFEDALVGIAAAHAGGMRVAAVTTTNRREQLDAADWVVDRLDELSIDQLWPNLSF